MSCRPDYCVIPPCTVCLNYTGLFLVHHRPEELAYYSVIQTIILGSPLTHSVTQSLSHSVTQSLSQASAVILLSLVESSSSLLTRVSLTGRHAPLIKL